jgi:hypothetical protein
MTGGSLRPPVRLLVIRRADERPLSRSADGDPPAATHRHAYLDRWLEIFAATARDVCPPAAATHFLDRAHRIADSLKLGIATQKGEIRPKRTRPARTFPAVQAATGTR